MSSVSAVLALVAAVVLFLYGLQGFTEQLRGSGETLLRTSLQRLTTGRWRGFMVGALATAVVQSSSAVTALTVALVDASLLSFRASLAVLLGANVGTTATAWLVSFKLAGLGPVLILLGALATVLPMRLRPAAKPLFYLGLILFALDLIAAQVQPLRGQPWLSSWLAMANSPWLGVLSGLLITALVQSSSVTTGVAILLVQQGVLPAEAAIPMVVGANVGSTSTALIVSMTMGAVARATALANLLFNAAGTLMLLPFLVPFSRAVVAFANDPGMAVALAHLLFNVGISALFLPILRPLSSLVASGQIPTSAAAARPPDQ
ncbi:Na/Pi symporter [Stenotrophomonas sp. 278]|uniref:Na/Pi cotransporter family protein n=1 Tax=Stenotrophomonas sp. 278 TaxID=2479851 RepID=UPI000F687E12|nr:Na/Pi symporter [Stenotrophomonas sp. 278]RRU25542.1 Na/Pi cotransporter family protein [Stenotrophomonas sp. 278]